MAKVPRPRTVPANPLPPPKQEPDQSRTAHELWLVLHLSRFMLDSLGGSIAALRSRPTPAKAAARRFPAKLAAGSQGIAVVDLQHGGKVVCACDAAAAAAGIAPGMALNSALALLPGLQVLARDERRERELLQALAEWAVRFTPRVSLEPPDAVLLEVRGSLRLFGGARRLIAQLRAELQAAGLEPCLALTPTPLASLWLARSGKEVALRRREALASALAPLPLACTRWPERSLRVARDDGGADDRRLPAVAARWLCAALRTADARDARSRGGSSARSAGVVSCP